MDWLIAGLGNPGPRYQATRHNIGRDAVAALARDWGFELDQVRSNARFGAGRRQGLQLCLVVPITFMNESGRAVAPLLRFFKVPPERLLVVYDDLDLPLGGIRLRAAGASGGHRGMQSIISALGTSEFPRLRLGIGRPPPNWDPADYVLAPFEPDERAIADEAIVQAAAVVEAAVRDGLDAAMNAFNR